MTGTDKPKRIRLSGGGTWWESWFAFEDVGELAMAAADRLPLDELKPFIAGQKAAIDRAKTRLTNAKYR